MKLQEAQALVEVPFDDTIASESSDEEEEDDTSEVEVRQEEAKVHSRHKSISILASETTIRNKNGQKVYGLGMPIVPLSPQS